MSFWCVTVFWLFSIFVCLISSLLLQSGPSLSITTESRKRLRWEKYSKTISGDSTSYTTTHQMSVVSSVKIKLLLSRYFPFSPNKSATVSDCTRELVLNNNVSQFIDSKYEFWLRLCPQSFADVNQLFVACPRSQPFVPRASFCCPFATCPPFSWW